MHPQLSTVARRRSGHTVTPSPELVDVGDAGDEFHLCRVSNTQPPFPAYPGEGTDKDTNADRSADADKDDEDDADERRDHGGDERDDNADRRGEP